MPKKFKKRSPKKTAKRVKKYSQGSPKTKAKMLKKAKKRVNRHVKR